jgi:hypothetical protein
LKENYPVDIRKMTKKSFTVASHLTAIAIAADTASSQDSRRPIPPSRPSLQLPRLLLFSFGKHSASIVRASFRH